MKSDINTNRLISVPDEYHDKSFIISSETVLNASSSSQSSKSSKKSSNSKKADVTNDIDVSLIKLAQNGPGQGLIFSPEFVFLSVMKQELDLSCGVLLNTT